MKKILLAGTVFAGMCIAGNQAANASAFPPIGSDTGPGVIITFGAGGAISSVVTGQPPYDNVEDTYIGVINNSGAPLTTLGHFHTGGLAIFGFDGDGLDTFGAPSNAADATGYGGPDTVFVVNSSTDGFINFVNPIPDGGTTFFSLEEAITINNNPFPAPEPASLALLGAGLVGLGAVRRHRKARS